MNIYFLVEGEAELGVYPRSAHQLIDVAYLQNLQNRLEQTPSHLRTLDNMVAFLQILAEEL